MAVQQHFITVGGLRLHYLERGQGEPLLLLHGYPQNHRCWRHQIAELARYYRVVAPDWFGWGQSERSSNHQADYHAEVERLQQLTQTLGFDHFNLAGHDYGGFLALGFAQRYPRNLKRLAIINSRAHRSFTPAFYRLTAFQCYCARRALLALLFTYGPLYHLHRRTLRNYVPGCFNEAELEDYIGWLRHRSGRRWWTSFFRHYEVAPRRELEEGLANLRLPTAVIWGDADRFCDTTIARDLAARIPNAELTILPGVGHFSVEEAPDAVLRALEQWLARPKTGQPYHDI
ncbi:alpha/beta hydrolase [Alloalcanivorax xenomutans]|uniref:alpha/beta fold hydrolase n=1 Tax=Alloalcanivorax xenomutans TaxID=1094342 RepID=UPI0024E1FE1E|nr:alpha/beta hydrolase [Alloalcanivorax xenomutans]WOD28814.1 alpha/beta hydrolase [Alloalcanivorax xenomutans]